MSKRKKPKFGRRGKVIQESMGYRQFRDAWLVNLLEEMSAACDRFWAKTPERRKIEAAHRRSVFNFGSSYE
jgi:hypothetical protein